MSTNTRVLIIAGEASGDIHAAHLVKEVKKLNPQVDFFGMGGDDMREAGVDIQIHYEKLAVVGIVEVIRHLPDIIKAKKCLKQLIIERKPEMVILVDYPGFNLPFAKYAKKLGLKVFYYISPQVWAWKKWRVKTIKHYVDKMAVIFPFEVDFYAKHGVQADYVGNALLEKTTPTCSKEQAMVTYGISSQSQCFGLMPGSRLSEIERILPTLIQTAELLQKTYPKAQFLLPKASNISKNFLQSFLKDSSLKIQIIEGHSYNALQCCQAIMVTSGTATLECALLQIPMVILYRISWITAILFYPFFFFIKEIGLCNVVAKEKVAIELLQASCRPEKIHAEIKHLLEDDSYREDYLQGMKRMRQRFEREEKDLGKVVNNLLDS